VGPFEGALLMAIGTLSPEAVRKGRVPTVRTRPYAARTRKAARKRVLAFLLLVTLTALAAGLVSGVWLIYSLSQKLPSVENLAALRLNPITTVVSSDGVLLATLETQHRRPVALSQISPYLIDATLAIEDSRFYEHKGIDPRGLARAAFANLCDGDLTGQGGSTLTQQLARNVFLSSEKTFRRKIEEMLLARKIEAAYSKNEILEMYLNQVYYGEGNYGIEAAARGYFGKTARKLTLGEAALLAGLPQRPAAYDPTEHLDAALKRRSLVLARMVATGKITAAQKAEAEAQPLHLLRPHPLTMADWKAPYFVTHVLKLLKAAYGTEFLYSGVRIETTLNWKMQQAAERALRAGLRSGWGANTGALVCLDPRTGFVRALVGGPDFRKNQFNAVTQGLRQPGSAFKPFVYAAAFENGVCDLWTTIEDKKLVYDAFPRPWVVHNYGGGYSGPVMALDALRRSINTVAVQVAEQTGPETVAYFAQTLGITTPMEVGLPLALGASAVHPLDLCSAYSAFANGGARYTPAFVARLVNAQGQEVWRDDPQTRYCPNFLASRTLDQINVALREVVLHGTGTAAASIPDAHGKTGTTNSHRDAWFVGYTGDLVTAVWSAHVRKTSKRDRAGNTVIQARYLPMPGATGGHLCAPIWRRFMAAAIPIQQKVNGAHGITSHPVAAPTLEELQMAYLAEQKRREALANAPQQGVEGQNTSGELTATGRVGGPFPLAAPTEASDEYESERQDDTAESQSLPAEQISSR